MRDHAIIYRGCGPLQTIAALLSAYLVRWNLQFVWWGIDRHVFGFERLKHSETKMARIYRWCLWLGPVEIRLWATRSRDISLEVAFLKARAIEDKEYFDVRDLMENQPEAVQ